MTCEGMHNKTASKVKRNPQIVFNYRLEDWWEQYPATIGLSYEDLIYYLSLRPLKGVYRYLSKVTNLDKDQAKVFCKYYGAGVGVGAYYKPVYWEKLLGCTPAEAELQITKYKTDKVTSKAGFISRYGEELGILKFTEFQRTSAISTEVKRANGTCFRESTPWCAEYWQKRGASAEEAISEVSNFQLNNAGVHRKVYEDKGIPPDEIDKIIRDINTSKNIYDHQLIKERHGLSDEDAVLWKEGTILKMVDGMVETGTCVPIEKQGEFKVYQTKVRALSKTVDVSHLPNISKRGKTFGDYNVDHKYSVLQCFLDKVPIAVASSIHNLQCITREANLVKAEKCSISLWALYYDYYSD